MVVMKLVLLHSRSDARWDCMHMCRECEKATQKNRCTSGHKELGPLPNPVTNHRNIKPLAGHPVQMNTLQKQEEVLHN